jgi:hypothetical protein
MDVLADPETRRFQIVLSDGEDNRSELQLADALREVQYAQRTWGDSPQLQATAAWICARSEAYRMTGTFPSSTGIIASQRRSTS